MSSPAAAAPRWSKPISVATSPSDRSVRDTSATPGGVADIAFRKRGDETRLIGLYQKAPLRVLFPRAAEPGVPMAVLLTTSGGLVGGDRMRIRVRLGVDARAMVTAQAAEKVYRSTGSDCRIRVDLAAEEGAFLEYLPQETILFEGARLDRGTAIHLEAGARVMAGEMLVFGRSASAEILTRGRVRDGWEIWRKQRLRWADTLLIDGDLRRPLRAKGGLYGAVALATLLYAGPDAEARLELARELMEIHAGDDLRGGDLRGGATVAGGTLVVRWLGWDARRLRRAFGTFWATFRNRVDGRADALPRLWSI